jgi:hypothetical protein
MIDSQIARVRGGDAGTSWTVRAAEAGSGATPEGAGADPAMACGVIRVRGDWESLI